MRAKIADLSYALEGRFGDHHALMCQLHLDHIAHLNDMIAKLDTQVEAMMVPFARQRDLLATIPGIGLKAAAAIISEIGTSPGEFFTTSAHLASWAGLCPGNHESAGKRKHGKPRKGSQHLQPCWWSVPGRQSALTGGSKPDTTGWCGALAATATPPPKNAPSSPSPTPSP
jgi:transposase